VRTRVVFSCHSPRQPGSPSYVPGSPISLPERPSGFIANPGRNAAGSDFAGQEDLLAENLRRAAAHRDRVAVFHLDPIWSQNALDRRPLGLGRLVRRGAPSQTRGRAGLGREGQQRSTLPRRPRPVPRRTSGELAAGAHAASASGICGDSRTLPLGSRSKTGPNVRRRSSRAGPGRPPAEGQRARVPLRH